MGHIYAMSDIHGCRDAFTRALKLIDLSGDPDFHDIYFDGESHYYIDGTTLFSGVLPIIKVDTQNDRYCRVTESGDWPILPYHEEY